MRKILTLVTLLSLLLAAPAYATTKDEAVAFVNKAVKMIKTSGQGTAFAAINNPADKNFHKGELYIFVYDKNGVCLAHGANSALIGKNLMNWKDADGKLFVKEYIDKATASGAVWTSYKFFNPVSRKIQLKDAYTVKVGSLYVGTGIYHE